jgi:hypothetical protein
MIMISEVKYKKICIKTFEAMLANSNKRLKYFVGRRVGSQLRNTAICYMLHVS